MNELFLGIRIPDSNKTLLHFNEEFEIVYVKKGSLKVKMGSKEYVLHNEHACVIMPYFTHSFSCSKNCNAIVLMFSREIFHNFVQQYMGLTAEKQIFKIEPYLATYAENLLSKPNIDNKCIADSLFSAFVCSYVLNNSFIKNTNSAEEVLPKVVEYIYQNIHEKIDLNILSANIGYTRRKLCNLFVKQTQTTLPAFINLIRINYAKSLLKKTHLNITEISQKCGFNSIRSFNRQFLTLTNFTPTDFRKKY